jgi:hypothetical protein
MLGITSKQAPIQLHSAKTAPFAALLKMSEDDPCPITCQEAAFTLQELTPTLQKPPQETKFSVSFVRASFIRLHYWSSTRPIRWPRHLTALPCSMQHMQLIQLQQPFLAACNTCSLYSCNAKCTSVLECTMQCPYIALPIHCNFSTCFQSINQNARPAMSKT